jgi:hypothetical protein
MKAEYIILIILGILIFLVSLFGGGLLFVLPLPDILMSILWFVGVILVGIGLWLNEKDKKAK